MINHVKTLLMNRRSGVGEVGVLYDDYIDPAYAPVSLPGWLADLRSVIFGRSPDQSMIAWRTQQLVAAIRASDLAPYETTFDPRRLWLGEPPPVVPASHFLPTLRNWSTPAPLVAGTPTPPDESGRMKRTFSIVVESGIASLVEIAGPATGTFSASAIQLSDTGFTAAAIGGDDSGEITVTRKPVWGFADILSRLSSLDVQQLFVSSTFSDDLAVFKGRYEQGTIVDRMAAVALAVAWRTEEIRRG